MTPKELAQTYAYDLWNHTEHLNRLVEIARHELEHGDYAEAKSALEDAKTPAGLVEHYLRSTLERIAEAEGKASDG